ncbi:heparan-alpha-glucosaminide N-acetyltransferase domain-containing protein [Olivibacter ginsenosidimutans]|uniref:Heparan-alpha-glucosaminide N-acetyltransferase domain-containing protein n=1 Tax=Olivibacter ginsenosidimutans TaxID=1176537 RepID=A0ABP9AYY2_9SPHI
MISTNRMNQRYYSLDVFRGATVALMILVNNPGTWSYAFSPLKHAPWHGCTPTDLVFPFFLFAVGNAMAFVIPKLQAKGDAFFWRKIIKRTFLIFFIGLLLSWYPFVSWSDGELIAKPWVSSLHPNSGIRILGVLQRIALCYGIASLLAYFFKTRTVMYIGAGILIVYWLACMLFGGSDPYSLDGWFGTAIDIKLLGIPHLYKGEGVPFDPEGLISTFTAIVQVIIGYLVGTYIRSATGEGVRLDKLYGVVSRLMVTAAILTLVGLTWGLIFPINKKIWTSSYVLYTSGLATTTLGVLIWFLEIRGIKNSITRFFDVFGKNALFIFIVSALIPKTLALIKISQGTDSEGNPVYTSPLRWFYSEIYAKIPGPPELGSFAYAICFLAVLWVICYQLDKKKIYVKV